jgi:hypothetical protein
MSTIAQEINAITEAQGGTATGQTIAEAVNALADTLAGEDVAGGRTITDAISKLAPYVGGGGGGGGFGAAYMLYSNQNNGSCYGAVDGEILYMSSFSPSSSYPTVAASGIDIYCSPAFTPYTCTGVTLEVGGVTTPIEFETGQSMAGTSGMTKFTIPAIPFDGGYDEQGMPTSIVRVNFAAA